MTPREVIEAASRESFSDEEHGPVVLRLKPGLPAAEIAAWGTERGLPVPPEIQDLLGFCAGFDLGGLGEVDFLGRHAFEFTAAFPGGVPVAGDGFGNFWVVDVHPSTGDWGPVYFVCHDPPVVVAQSPHLGPFLQAYFDLVRPGKSSALEAPTDGAVLEIGSKNPGLLDRETASASPDGVLAGFARGLSPDFEICDLRRFEAGKGFSWGRNGPDTVIHRHPVEPLFGIEKRRGFFRRFF